MIQNITNQVENKINNIQKNNDYDKMKKRQQHNSTPSYNPPQNYGGHGGYRGGGRVNPMNLINDAINNHPANAKMQEKYGHLANLGPDGYVKGSGGVVIIQKQIRIIKEKEVGQFLKIIKIKKGKMVKAIFYFLVIQMVMDPMLNLLKC